MLNTLIRLHITSHKLSQRFILGNAITFCPAEYTLALFIQSGDPCKVSNPFNQFLATGFAICI